MGIGMLEVGVILLVAFLVMGPIKSIGMARTAGRLIRSFRSTLSDIAAAVDLEGDESTPRRTTRQPPDSAEPTPPRDEQ